MGKLYFLFVILFSLSTIAQSKKEEKEIRVSKNEMPKQAILLLDDFKHKKFLKTSYFFETDKNKKSYEAKFIYKKLAYSIEFSENGDLQDVEIVEKHQKLPQALMAKIEAFLQQKFDANKIEKIQSQYLNKGNAKKTLQKSFQHKKPDNYELIVQVKKDKKYFVYEFLFTASGELIKKQKVHQNAYDYLIF